MGQKLDNAISLYLEGIRDGNIDVVDKYTGDRYTQHSTGVEDGTEGFKAFFKGFLQRTSKRDIQVIRAIEDGPYVFVHVFQDIDHGTAKWITTDMFNTDESDKIVEHWDVIAAYTEIENTASGNDVIFGEFELKDLDKTEYNKAHVRRFLVEIFQNKNYEKLPEFISTEKYIQHNPNAHNGIEGLETLLTTLNFQYDFVFHVMGQGNHVVSYSKVSMNGEEYAVFDIFRLEAGKIVEHWDNIEPIPPRSEWANTGKF